MLYRPGEQSTDHGKVLGIACEMGHVSATELIAGTGWDSRRAQMALDDLVKEGIAWVDTQTGTSESEYWMPGLLSSTERASRA